MKHRPARRFASAVICLAPALFVAACSRPEPPPPAARPVVVVTVGEDAQAGVQLYSGEVRARHEIDLSFRIGGKLVERKVGAGETVRRGQALARIDAQDVQLSGAAARAQVSAAEADVTLARSEFERAQALLAQRFISQSVLDNRRTQLAAAESRLKQAQAQADVQGNALGYTTLSAEREGVITAAPVESGQVVAAGQTVLRLADPREREVLIWVPEARLSGIKPGMPALVRAWSAQDKTFAGSVREVSASADPATRTYAVRVAISKPDDSLPLGATAGVGFQTAGGQGVTLPLAAVIREGEASKVWVVGKDDALALRAVDVAQWRDDAAVLRSGLQGGERVVVVGAHMLKADMKVQPVARSAPVVMDIKR